jgi:nucleotide-binding universal stress UspA family protein
VFHKVLVGFDGSEGSWRALRQAIQLAREHGAELVALSVEEPLPHYASAASEVRAEESEVAAYFERLQGEARRAASQQGVVLQTEAVRGHAAQAIVDYACQVGADLIVVGQHGHAGLLQRMLGSTSDRVVDTARCAVLVVRGDEGGT